MVIPMNQDLEYIRENSGRARDSGVEKVLEFNGLWHGECYRNWFVANCESNNCLRQFTSCSPLFSADCSNSEVEK